jgi:hypothetical protein
MRTRMSLALATLIACGAVGTLLPAPAVAASYRFWTYWQGQDTGWTFASVGPAYALPVDGSVDGWSFAVSAVTGGPDAAPRDAPDFEAICAGVAPEPGLKRVALVVDPGDPAIAPSGEVPIAPVRTCVRAPEDATGYDILRSVLTVRTQDGLVCGLGGYPADECAPVLAEDDVAVMAALTGEGSSASDADSSTVQAEVDAVAQAGDASDGTAPSSGSGTPLTTLAVLVGLGAVAAVAFAVRRRRERATPHA